MKWLVYALLFFLIFTAERNFACTVIYICREGRVLGGSNEDWKDPNTRMWFYPSAEGRNGWVKFGFAGGFPQAGMNDSGLFWDGTSNPWQDMPFSELNKTKIDGPLMQKVMEECHSMDDAIGVIRNYYCDDQYRGQYLIGGDEGTSVIVDGDYLHQNDFSYQVLTNFHISNPELGGFPCHRYSLAQDMLDSCTIPTPSHIGYVLSATYQDGNYPTQYSIIYDPSAKEVYVFYYHNFHEYLLLKLNECLLGDTCSYAIPSLFSRLALQYPENGALIHSDSVILKWIGMPGKTFELRVTDKCGELIHQAFVSDYNSQPAANAQYYSFLLLPLILLNFRSRTCKLTLFVVCILFLSNCKKEEEPVIDDSRIEYTHTVCQLVPGETYYWKVLAPASESSALQTESITYSFKCESL